MNLFSLFQNIKEKLSVLGSLNVTKAILILPVLLAVLISCADHEDLSGGVNDGLRDEIIIQFAIPDMKTVVTRAGDSDVTKVDAFVFGKNQEEKYETFLLHQSFTQDRISNNSVALTLSGDARGENVLIYLIANVNDDLSSLKTIEGIKQSVISSDLSGGLPMIGSQEINTNQSIASMMLRRIPAKVSAESTVDNAEVKAVQIYGNATKGYLYAPLNLEAGESTNVIHTDKSGITPSLDNFGESKVVYTYPSIAYTHENKSGAYAIVAVNRENSMQYYRLNFRQEDSNGNLNYIDLNPNHHYYIKITGFFTGGYESPEEAANHPEADQYIVYEIHDHANEVLSMVTDGYNELGVTPEVVLQQLSSVEKIVVKCYSAADNYDVNFQAVGGDRNDLQILRHSDWLVVQCLGKHENVIEPDENHYLVHDPTSDWDEDNHGFQFEFQISINQNAKEVDDEGEVVFIWNGLERTVKVTYDAAFLLAEVCDVDLTIKNNDENNNYDIQDYWTFVRSQGTLKEREGRTPKLWGILPEDMTNGKKRNGGFHFPMPYGSNANWEYTYKVNFDKLVRLNNKTGIKDITISVATQDSPAYFTENTVKWEYAEGQIEGNLSYIGDNKLYYSGGNIYFNVEYDDGEKVRVDASLYHTGFFHFEGNPESGNQYVPAEDVGYYYYEVVPMGDGYWLDRNIGAKANTTYIDIEDSSTNAGRVSVGRHYSINYEMGDFTQPDFDYYFCPPGYHIPNTTEWDALRMSAEFETMSVVYNNTTYMTTYYKCGGKIGNIYLQKARFYNGKNAYQSDTRYSMEPNNGDAGAGYYWSITEAPAMEKEQMGNWVRALYLNGSASSYVNASLADHRMPIRCKAGKPGDASHSPDYYFSFNVHEATHVYLFEWDAEDDHITPLYTFPGRAIGSTASAEKWQSFYCSTTVEPEKLRMLFVKLENDGKVRIYYKKDGTSFDSSVSYSETFVNDSTMSWPILEGANYDFCEVGAGRDVNVLPRDQKPTDCKTTSGGGNSGSGGGGDNPGGGKLSGDYLWTGGSKSDEFWWGGNQWKNLTGDNYDWSSVTPGSVLTITINLYWGGSSTLQFYGGDWSRFPGYEGDLKPGYNGQTGTYTMRKELAQEDIDLLIEKNGFLFQGDNFMLLEVKLEVK